MYVTTFVMTMQGDHSLGLMWWMLAREVLRLRGTISRETPWDVMPDLYFYRDPEEAEHEEEELKDEAAIDQPIIPDDTWAGADKVRHVCHTGETLQYLIANSRL